MTMDKNVVKVLNKLFDKGYVIEKDIVNLGLEDLLSLQIYSPGEITILIELKEAVKSNKLLTYLSRSKEIDKQTSGSTN